MAKLATCTRCNKIIYLAEEVGLRWTADLTPLDAQAAIQALVDGREVYRVTQPGNRLSTAKPDVLKALRERGTTEGPVVVASHPCPSGAAKALKPVLPAVQEEGGPGAPKASAGPSERRTAQLSGQPTGSSSVPAAVTSRSEGRAGPHASGAQPRCDGCGQPCADGTYASIALGDIVQWAHHVDACGGRS